MLNVQAKNLENIGVLQLQGQIVNGEIELLRNAVRSFSKALSEVSVVKLDLAQVTTVDAAGLGVMLELREQFQSKGIRFELVNLNKRVSMVLKLARLDSVFQITSAVEFFPAVPRSLQVSSARLSSCA